MVDDDAAIGELVAEYLRGRGFDVSVAVNGAAACAAIATHPPTAVITDLRLPDRDGVEIIRAAAGRRPPVPVLVTTGYGTVEGTIAAFQAGATDFLVKPFRLRDLHAALERALERARVEGETLFRSAALALLEQAALAEDAADAAPLVPALVEVLAMLPGLQALTLGAGEPLGAHQAITVTPAEAARPYVLAVHRALLRCGS